MSNFMDKYTIANGLVTIAAELHRLAGDSIVSAGHSFSARVGKGQSTNHKLIDREHVLTFGVLMVEDKLTEHSTAKWLSVREIARYRFYNGKVNLINLMAHVILHEYAHALQTVAGERLRGSVHNSGFYRILRNLHAEHGETIREKVIAHFESHGISTEWREAPKQTLTETTPFGDRIGDPRRAPATPTDREEGKHQLATGQTVSFTHKDRRIVGTIQKMNPTRAKVDTAIGTYNVPYRMLSAVTEGEDTTPITTPQPLTLRAALRAKFHRNQRVVFEYKGRPVKARIIRCNDKTATVEAELNSQQWRVSYGLLKAA
jgi:hypothetical protein